MQNPYETAAPLLSFDHADKYYTNAGERVRALDDVSLDVGSRIDSILDGLVLGKKNLSILAKKAGQGEICPPTSRLGEPYQCQDDTTARTMMVKMTPSWSARLRPNRSCCAVDPVMSSSTERMKDVKTAILLVPLSNPSPERIDHRVLENRRLLMRIAVPSGFARVLA